MHIILLTVLLLGLVFGPGLWVQRVMARYKTPDDRYRDQGTGGEHARHLLDRFELPNVVVEPTDQGDHYDPSAKAVRLTRDKFDGYSLTAIAVAAHEVGHALQDRDRKLLFLWRQRLVGLTHYSDKVGVVFVMLAPLAAAITRAPHASLSMLLLGLGSMALVTVVHLVTLPLEWDASFGKALPVLTRGEYLKSGDEEGARRLLKAAAFTYVAVSLVSLLNVWRWLRILRV